MECADSSEYCPRLNLEHFRQPSRDDLRSGHIMAALRPLPDPLLAGAEQTNLKVIDVLLHPFEMSGPQVRFLRADALFTLPAHAMEQQCAVRRNKTASAGRK